MCRVIFCDRVGHHRMMSSQGFNEIQGMGPLKTISKLIWVPLGRYDANSSLAVNTYIEALFKLI